MLHKIIFCGDRNWKDYNLILSVMLDLKGRLGQFTVIEGEAKGADTLSVRAAVECQLVVDAYPAQWVKYGRAAGPIRNQQMISEGEATAVVAFHEDLRNSRGTRNMVEVAIGCGLPTWVSEQGYGHSQSAFDKFAEKLQNQV